MFDLIDAVFYEGLGQIHPTVDKESEADKILPISLSIRSCNSRYPSHTSR